MSDFLPMVLAVTSRMDVFFFTAMVLFEVLIPIDLFV